MKKENQDALNNNRALMHATGVYDHIHNKVEHLKKRWGHIENKIKPMKSMEVATDYQRYLVEHSNSKNMLKFQNAILNNSRQLADDIKQDAGVNINELSSDDLNRKFTNTSYHVAEYYGLTKSRVV